MEHAQWIRSKAILLTHFSSRYNIEVNNKLIMCSHYDQLIAIWFRYLCWLPVLECHDCSRVCQSFCVLILFFGLSSCIVFFFLSPPPTAFTTSPLPFGLSHWKSWLVECLHLSWLFGWGKEWGREGWIWLWLILLFDKLPRKKTHFFCWTNKNTQFNVCSSETNAYQLDFEFHGIVLYNFRTFVKLY